MAKSSEADAAGAPKSTSAAPELPLFYHSVVPLDPGRHAGKTVRATNDYAFARAANAVPLNGVEFSQALRHYPIVFTIGKPVMSLAVLGVRADSNLFVDGEGRWQAGAYIPAYVRRYPFIFITGSDPDKFILGIDETAPHFVSSEGGAPPMFAGNDPSAQVKHALTFCSEYEAHNRLTQEFCEAVDQQGLLVDQNAQFEFKSGDRARIQGFRIIDEAKLQALPDDVFVAWRKKGYLPLVFAHLFSMRSWADLLDRAAGNAG